jgi:nicotinate-nucleotide pyrophosphorylase (carboxylating)
MLEAAVGELVARALAEDLGPGDVTSASILGPADSGSARIVAREPGILAGTAFAREVFRQVGHGIEWRAGLEDGDGLAPGQVVAHVSGPSAAILAGERTALNFLQHLSGIATQTRRLADLTAGTGARILDTRKTVPGMRLAAKAAVRAGGGTNHRTGLFDGILIKDNHIAAAGGVRVAVQRARAAGHLLRIEVEAETLEQVAEALDAGADVILLDNMDPATLRRAVDLCRGRALTEASGRITEATVRAVAEAGVDFISVGALTHSVRALDLSMEWLGA